MLDLLGADYVLTHIIEAYNQRLRHEAYEIYMTDCVSAIARGLGAKISKRFYDILHPKVEDKRDAEDIINDLTRKMGLKVVDSNDDSNVTGGDSGA